MSEEQYQAIQEKVEESKMTQSDFVFNCCINKEVLAGRKIEKVAVEIGKIGNHLLQLTKLAKQGLNIPKGELQQIQKELDQMWQILKRYVE